MPKVFFALAVMLGVIAFPVQAAPEDKGLLIWINADKPYRGLERVGQMFTKATRIKVTVEHPANAPDRFEQAAKAGGGPDIWIWAHDGIGNWIKNGYIRPVNPSASVKAQIVDVGWDAFTVDGKVWGYPLALESVALVYNRELIKVPPVRFEDLFAINEQMQAKGIRTIGWDYNNPYYSWPLLAAGGGYAFSRNIKGSYDPKNTGVNQPGAVKGAEFLYKLVQQGVLPPPEQSSYAEVMRAFREKRLAMMVVGPWAWQELARAKVDFGVVKLPALNSLPAKPFVGVLGVMINSNSQHEAVARDFIENYLLKPQGLRVLNADVSIGVPADKSVFRELFLDEKFRGSMDNIYQGKPMPSIPEMANFWAAMGPALTRITAGKASAKVALDEAARKTVGGK